MVALGQPARADPGDRAAHRRLRDRRRLARASAGSLLALCCVMGTGTIAACWGVRAGAALQDPGAAPLMQAGMFVARPDHDRLRAARAAQGWLADDRPDQPADPGRRGRPPGLRRRAITWADTWPGLRRARRAARACSASSPCAGCARTSLTERERARRASAGAVLEASARRGRARGVPLLLHAPEPDAATRGSGTGTRASRRSSGGASTRRARATSSRRLLDAMRADGFIGHVDLLGPAAHAGSGSSTTTSPRATPR